MTIHYSYALFNILPHLFFKSHEVQDADGRWHGRLRYRSVIKLDRLHKVALKSNVYSVLRKGLRVPTATPSEPPVEMNGRALNA